MNCHASPWAGVPYSVVNTNFSNSLHRAYETQSTWSRGTWSRGRILIEMLFTNSQLTRDVTSLPSIYVSKATLACFVIVHIYYGSNFNCWLVLNSILSEVCLFYKNKEIYCKSTLLGGVNVNWIYFAVIPQQVSIQLTWVRVGKQKVASGETCSCILVSTDFNAFTA